MQVELVSLVGHRGTIDLVLINLVLQEWWGLNAHMQKLSSRFASAGFAALAPDLYRGKVASTADEASHLMDALNWDTAMNDVANAAEYLREEVGVKRVAVMGFCMGGALTIAAACRVPHIDAGRRGRGEHSF